LLVVRMPDDDLDLTRHLDRRDHARCDLLDDLVDADAGLRVADLLQYATHDGVRVYGRRVRAQVHLLVLALGALKQTPDEQDLLVTQHATRLVPPDETLGFLMTIEVDQAETSLLL